MALFLASQRAIMHVYSHSNYFLLRCYNVNVLHQNVFWNTTPSTPNSSTTDNSRTSPTRRTSVHHGRTQEIAQHHDVNVLPSACLLPALLRCCWSYHGDRNQFWHGAGFQHHFRDYLSQLLLLSFLMLLEDDSNQERGIEHSSMLCKLNTMNRNLSWSPPEHCYQAPLVTHSTKKERRKAPWKGDEKDLIHYCVSTTLRGFLRVSLRCSRFLSEIAVGLWCRIGGNEIERGDLPAPPLFCRPSPQKHSYQTIRLWWNSLPEV